MTPIKKLRLAHAGIPVKPQSSLDDTDVGFAYLLLTYERALKEFWYAVAEFWQNEANMMTNAANCQEASRLIDEVRKLEGRT